MIKRKKILFTGLIRNEGVFLDKLIKAANLKSENVIDDVILSTWEGEIQKYPKVRKFFDDNAFQLIESSQPNLKLQGHVFHQMKTLSYGLDICGEECYVYKMRPDLGSFDENIKCIFEGSYESQVEIAGGWPQLFNERVVIESAVAFHPFYINDIQFYGDVEDLKKLINFDLFFEVHYSKLAPEQFFYFKNFHDIGNFRKYFRVNQGIHHNDDSKNLVHGSLVFQDPFLMQLIASYWAILSKYFYFRKTPATFVRKQDTTTSRNIIEGDVPGFRKLSKKITTPIINSQHFSEYIARSSEHNVNLLFNMYNDIRNDYSAIHPYSVEEIKRFYKDYGEHFNLKSRKDIQQNGQNHFKVYGHNLRIQQLEINDYTEELEKQISFMRRKIQELSASDL